MVTNHTQRSVVIRPSRIKPSELQRRESEEINTIHATRLDRARKAAEGWGAGAAAMLGLIATLSVVKGPDTLEGVAGWGKAIIGGCLLLALIIGINSIRLFTRAAYGRLEPIPMSGPPGLRLDCWRQVQYRQVQRDITLGMRTTYVVIALAVAALAMSWLLPR